MKAKTYLAGPLTGGNFIAVAGIFLAVGGWNVWQQADKLSRYAPTEATVLGTDVKRDVSTDSDGDRSVSYTPMVDYRYEVDGETYQGGRVTPLDAGSSDRGWAEGVARRFNEVDTVTIYYDPASPGDAFLLRHVSFFPYIFVVFPMLFLVLGVAAVAGLGTGSPKADQPQHLGGRRYRVKPRASMQKKLIVALIGVGLWYGLGGGVLTHYFVSAQEYSLFAKIATGIYLALGLVTVYFLVRYVWLKRMLGDATLTLDTNDIRLGDTVAAEVSQPVRDGLTVKDVNLALVCTKHWKEQEGDESNHRQRELHRDEQSTASQNRDVTAGQQLNFEASFSIPADKPASGAMGSTQYIWHFEVDTDVAGKPDYAVKFPITVGSAGEGEESERENGPEKSAEADSNQKKDEKQESDMLDDIL
jgi:hypothetical protein